MAFQFPWTNLHELNLDWFLSKFKQFTNNFLGTTATAESVPYGTQPSVTVTGGELDEDTDVTDPFTFNFKIPAGQPGAQGEQGEQGVPGQDGFSPIATVTKSGTVATITITDVNGTTTTTISDGEVTQAQLDTKAPAILPTVSGSIANFPDGADDIPVADLVVDIEPVQSGSGDPSPDNVRPITGWTGCNVTRTGKNLFNKNIGVTTKKIRGDDGTESTSSASGYTNALGGFLPNTQYTISGTLLASSQSMRIYYLDERQNWISRSSSISYGYTPYTFTTPAGCRWIQMQYNLASADFDTVQIEIGSTVTDYEEYQGTTVNIDWTTEAGTVYGGSLDVTTGVLTVDRKGVALNGTEEWSATSAESLDIYVLTVSDAVSVANDNTSIQIISDKYKSVSAYTATHTGRKANSIAIVSNTRIFVTVPSGTYADASAFEAALTNSPLQVVYKLATPITYNLTPTEVKTLLGTNNIWADTGDVDVDYRADTKLYIERLTMPTEDDLVANSAISSGSFFMIGNTLYRATTAIASGSQIIPGTNATPMSLADALNLL